LPLVQFLLFFQSINFFYKKKYKNTWNEILAQFVIVSSCPMHCYSTENVANCATIWKGESLRRASTLLDLWKNRMQRTQSLLCSLSGKIFLLALSCCLYTQRYIAHALEIETSGATILRIIKYCTYHLIVKHTQLLQLHTNSLCIRHETKSTAMIKTKNIIIIIYL
jgi:hypothetical protein